MNGRRATAKEHEYIKKVLNANEAKPANVSKIILPVICIAIVFVIIVQIGSNSGVDISPLIACFALFGGMAILASGAAKEKNAINNKNYILHEGFAFDYVPYKVIETQYQFDTKCSDIKVSNAKIRFVYNEDPSEQS